MYEFLKVTDKILLVGEGDFSFSVSLCKTLKVTEDSQVYIVSTSYESDETIQKHKNAVENIDWLRNRGVKVLLDVDARKLHQTELLLNGCSLFTKIIFNFPHTGGKSNIKRNRALLNDFFQSAGNVLSSDGKILVTLCRGQGGTPADQPQRKWKDSWQVTLMAANAGLILTHTSNFIAEDHYDYSSTGFRSQDKHFHTEGAITHVFEKAECIVLSENPQPAVVTHDGKMYHCQQYLYNKMKRCVFEDEGHPFRQIYERLTFSFSEQLPCKSLIPKNFSNVLSHYVDVSIKHLIHTRTEEEKSTEKYEDGEIQDTPFCYYLKRVDDSSSIAQENLIRHTPDVETSVFDEILAQTNSLGFHECCIPVHHRHDKNIHKSRDQYYNCDINSNSGEKKYKEWKDSANCTDLPSFVDASSNVHLRFSLLEHIEEIWLNSSQDELSFLYGCTFRPCTIAPDRFPCMHEMIGVINSTDESSIPHKIVTTLKNVLNCNVKVSNTSTEKQMTLYKMSKWTLKMHKEIVVDHSEDDVAGEDTDDFCRKQGRRPVGSLWRIYNDHDTVCAVAFVLDLEQLSQIVFQLDDVRLLWSRDTRVCEQWKTGKSFSEIKAVSLYPLSFRHDKSFWENSDIKFDELLFCDIIRDLCGEVVRTVQLIDKYVDPKTGDISYCYRLTFESCDKALSYDTSWRLQSMLRLQVQKLMGIQLR